MDNDDGALPRLAMKLFYSLCSLDLNYTLDFVVKNSAVEYSTTMVN